jgi:hypothetical protein
MKSSIVSILVALAPAAWAQAPEQIPNPQALYDRGETLDTQGRALARNTDDVQLRRQALELQHQGVIDKERAIDVQPEVYRNDDALLRRAMRSR